MPPSPFIQIRTIDSSIVFNTAHIISLKQLDVPLTEANRHFFQRLPEKATMGYLIHVNTTNTRLSNEGTGYLFVTKEERDSMYDVIAAALAPVVITDPFLPH